jgi:hypothetical protein
LAALMSARGLERGAYSRFPGMEMVGLVSCLRDHDHGARGRVGAGGGHGSAWCNSHAVRDRATHRLPAPVPLSMSTSPCSVASRGTDTVTVVELHAGQSGLPATRDTRARRGR